MKALIISIACLAIAGCASINPHREAMKEQESIHNLSGVWKWSSSSDAYYGFFNIEESDGKVAGVLVDMKRMSQGHKKLAGGDLTGSVSGNTFTMTRKFGPYTQYFTLNISGDGTALEGSFDGDRDCSVGTDFTATRYTEKTWDEICRESKATYEKNMHDLSGEWEWSSSGGAYYGFFSIEQSDGEVTGELVDMKRASQGHTMAAGGNLTGSVSGNTLTMTRQFGSYTQYYTLNISDDGNALEGSFDGDRDYRVGTDFMATRCTEKTERGPANEF